MTYITFSTHAEYILLFLLISMIYIACIAHNHLYVFSYSYNVHCLSLNCLDLYYLNYAYAFCCLNHFYFSYHLYHL